MSATEYKHHAPAFMYLVQPVSAHHATKGVSTPGCLRQTSADIQVHQHAAMSKAGAVDLLCTYRPRGVAVTPASQTHSLAGEHVLRLDLGRQECQAANELDRPDMAGARVAPQRHHHRLQHTQGACCAS